MWVTMWGLTVPIKGELLPVHKLNCSSVQCVYNKLLLFFVDSIPINGKCLKRLKPCDEQKWNFFCNDEQWHEARVSLWFKIKPADWFIVQNLTYFFCVPEKKWSCWRNLYYCWGWGRFYAQVMEFSSCWQWLWECSWIWKSKLKTFASCTKRQNSVSVKYKGFLLFIVWKQLSKAFLKKKNDE